MKTLKEGLNEYPIIVTYNLEEAKLFRKALRLTQESHALWEKEEEIEFGGEKHIQFTIHCSTTNFAASYWSLGINTERLLLSKRKNGK